MHDRTLVAGTIEYIIVDVKDRLSEINDLSILGPVYTVRDAEDNVLYASEPANATGMKIKCLIDTTVGEWPIGKYELFIRFNANPEIPVLGPIDWWLRSE